MDALIITGVGVRLDGRYQCDVVSLLDVSSPAALTVREAEQVKTISGARGSEIATAFLAGDMACRMAVALIILRREGKDADPAEFWDRPIGAIRFELGAAEEKEGPPTTEGETPSTSGGGSGNQTSDAPESELSPTGAPV